MASATRANGRAPRVPAREPQPQQAGATQASTLAEAVLRVQAKAPQLIRNATGQVQSRTYRYVTNDVVVDAVLPLLVEEQLLWQVFPTTHEDGAPAARYRMTFVPSGEFDEDTMKLACILDPQGQGSGLTYARRYALVAYLNLTVDPDDDGRGAMPDIPRDGTGTSGDEPTQPQPSARPAQPTERPANAKQQAMLKAKAKGLSPERFANLILLATGDPERDWSDEDAAARWIERAIDRFPAVHVTELKSRLEAVNA